MPAPPKIGHGYRLVFDEAERLAERVLRFGPHPLLAKKDLFEKSREFQREAADAGCRVLKIESCERDQRKDLHYPVRDLEPTLWAGPRP